MPQESNSFENHPEDDSRPADTRSNRIRASLAGRKRYLAVATLAIAGFGIVGLPAVTTGNHDADSTGVATVRDHRARAAADQRADRSRRDGTAGTAAPGRAPTSKAPEPRQKPKPAWVSPMPGARVSSCFGPRSGLMHAGIDFAAPENTPIHAVGAGSIVSAGWDYAGYGISVFIDHANGYLTHYAHLNRTAVEVGQRVEAGDVIGYEGSTGDSTGPHLHFEVHQGGMWKQINPAPWLRDRGVDVGC